MQREESKSRNAKGGVQGEMQEVECIAERETATHANTLVGQRPRADPSCLRQHSARGQGGGIPARKISSSEVSAVICRCSAYSGAERDGF